ncbi:MAG: AAA family ATPase, partial [Verrucomicrobia bacterium]|nr:AAA family ATPase [Verrucomicrobiota bacterium]
MDDLFAEAASPAGDPVQANAPLAARMRPQSLEEFVGQEHILGPGKLLRRAIESDRLTSIILYGPPGVGKTSLAQVIAKTTSSHFERLSGVESSVADIRKTVAAAKLRLKSRGMRTILFVDEIHRFNKAQQDVLLPDVESGVVRLIGATTHNPFFYVNSPLVSRSQI